ncbi:MAG: isoprenylcysteine carboxylmethyltransferase family protein [bacterium]|nr:isoprenylcysteine carboxylmethyltransferase family protein [bacterium]
MLHETIGIATFLAIGIGSARLYEPGHRSREYATDRPGTIASPRGFRAVYHWIRYSTIAIGIAAVGCRHPALLQFHHTPVLLHLGLAIAAAGFVVFAAAKQTLGRQYSPCFDAYLPTRLVRRGPYRFVRHPIYTANLTTMVGLSLASGSLWLLANTLLLTIYYWLTARVEERALVAEVDGYLDYSRTTGRFVPRLWRRTSATAG